MGVPGMENSRVLSSSIFRRLFASSGAKPPADAKIDTRVRIGRVNSIHVVALLVGDHFQRELVVVAQKHCPLTILRDRRRLLHDVDNRENILAQLESIIERTRKPFIEFGKALLEIRDSKLYRPQYSTFEQYCQGRWRFGRRHVNQVIRSSQAVLQLQDTQNLGTMVPKIQTERQARALADVPKDQRPEVLKEAEKSGKLTARSITEAAEKIVKAEVIERDHEGHQIPLPAQDTWNRRHEVDEFLQHLSKIKSWAEKLQKSSDRFYAVKSFSAQEVYTDCGNIYRMIKDLIPWSICPTCQGQAPKTCALCHGRGMISKHTWDSGIDSVTKKMMKKKAEDDSSKINHIAMYQPLAGILGYAVDLRHDILAGRSQRSHDILIGQNISQRCAFRHVPG